MGSLIDGRSYQGRSKFHQCIVSTGTELETRTASKLFKDFELGDWIYIGRPNFHSTLGC